MLNIGDTAWLAEYRRTETKVTCPDCCGKKALTVIMGDESRVSIECDACKGTGLVIAYGHEAVVHEVKIRVIEQETNGRIRYNHSDDIRMTQVDAELRAGELRSEHEKWVNGKKEVGKSWAWHVSYWRRQIEQYERDLANAKRMLSVSQSKAERSETHA